MEQIDFLDKEHVGIAARARQLLQVWRDYYDEIFEVDMKDGSFESMMESEHGYWTQKGFADIEVILLAEKHVHPDDKQNFKDFFDMERIRANMERGIYVTKINFRMHREGSDDYFWIKVKNIIPTKRTGDSVRFFSCFRRVDDETEAELRYKQQLSDALDAARTLAHNKSNIVNQTFKEIRSPLSGMAGMISLAIEDTEDEATRARLKKIEEEALRLNRVIDLLIEADAASDAELPDMDGFEDHPVNRISYNRTHGHNADSFEEGTDADEGESIPEDYVFMTGSHSHVISRQTEFDFSGKKFLIVEDNELNAEVMAELVKATGAEADLAFDGKMAVISFVSKPAGTYDAILMDIDIPVIDGYAATQCIRISGKEDSRTVPVFAVTSNSFDDDVVKSYEYGFNAFFTKPVDFGKLFEKISRELGRRND